MFNGLGKRILIMFAVMQFVVLATGCQDMDNRSMRHGIVSDTGGMNDVDAIDYSTSMIINNALASSRAASIDSNKNSDSAVNKASISSKTTKGNEGLTTKNKVGTSKGNASTHRITSKSKVSTNSNGNSKVSISKSRVSSSITHSSTRSVRTKR